MQGSECSDNEISCDDLGANSTDDAEGTGSDETRR